MVSTVTSTPPRKLKLLYLHGYNETPGIVPLQMANFMATFGDLIELHSMPSIRFIFQPVMSKFLVQKTKT